MIRSVNINLMIMIITLATIIQSMAISLGVGSSTLAIINFFVAIADGAIDETERKMMGVVYKVLRVAMVLILITTILLLLNLYSSAGLAGFSGIENALFYKDNCRMYYGGGQEAVAKVVTELKALAD